MPGRAAHLHNDAVPGKSQQRSAALHLRHAGARRPIRIRLRQRGRTHNQWAQL